MKKGFRIFVAMSIILCIGLVNAPQTVEAKDTKVAEGAWLTGTEVDVDAQVPDNLNLLTKGVKVTKLGLICHPFRGGRYHWVGEIRQLKNGDWVKLKTTNDWYPDNEGQFMSCAEAPSAGIYALFGYYNGPLEITYEDASDVCSTYVVNTDGFTINYFIYALNSKTTTLMAASVHFTPEIPAGTMVSYTVSSTSPGFIGGGTRSLGPVAATDIGLGISGFVDFKPAGVYVFRTNSAETGDFDFVYHIEGCGDVPYHVSLPRKIGL